MSDAGDNIAAELAQGPIFHAARAPERRPEKEVFLPWHKPRKHWVRVYQWGLESQRLIEQLGIATKRSLRYLTLPGPDMLDIRSLHDVCSANGARLNFVGYIQPTRDDVLELELSEAEVRDMSSIDAAESRIVRDDFQSLADSNSVGTSAILNGESFDVINVDLCKCVGEFEPDDKQRAYYDSIKSLFTLQVRKRRAQEPWLFFITTRADADRVSPESRTRFFDLLVTACKESETLSASLNEHLGLSVTDLSACAAGKHVHALPFERLFGLALGQWLAHLLGGFSPQVRVTLLKSSRAYGVKAPEAFDMLSLAFKCETVYREAQDQSMLSSATPEGELYRVSDSVAAMIELIASLTNLDSAFRAHKQYHTLTEKAAPFMAAARFNAEKYRDWAWKQREATVAMQEASS